MDLTFLDLLDLKIDLNHVITLPTGDWLKEIEMDVLSLLLLIIITNQIKYVKCGN